jgi:ABC-type nickel/cobalt efflux system permease component RcnA
VRRGLGAALAVVGALLAAPGPGAAHPLGNFSISHYAGIRIERDGIRLRYLIDMAEIPTFQELQASGLVPDAEHPSLAGYLKRTAATLADGLVLELDGRRLALHADGRDALFAAGAGGLPTLKLGFVYQAGLDGAAIGVHRLRYRDGNFPDRAGWKEVVATAGPGAVLFESSVPARDRSRELSDYPTDLLDSPPQDVEAHLVFTREPSLAMVAAAPSGPDSRDPAPPAGPRAESPAPLAGAQLPTPALPGPPASADAPRSGPGEATREALRLQPNVRATPRDAFTELIAVPGPGLGFILLALVIAAGLGAFHALEPGHGKTVVAAYLVGSRGTAGHAVLLGLTVTVAHTAGVYLLGAITLYASRYVVPERLYPWLGALSGLTITALGVVLLLRRWRRWRGAGADQEPLHQHGPRGPHRHPRGAAEHSHGHVHPDGHHSGPERPVSLRDLLALGITGGIVPCPAALVVLLSALAVRRVGFGLLLIVAFSAGLAAVLIGIGILMVYARRLMGRFRAEGPIVTRWLPLASAAVIAVTGVVLTAQALTTAGVLPLRL